MGTEDGTIILMEYFSVWEWKKQEIVFFAGVVLVILVISAVQLRTGAMKTRDAQRKADAELVTRALVRYLGDYRILPADDNGAIISCGREGMERCDWGEGEIVDGDKVVYLKKLPVDPKVSEGRRYVYEADDKRQTFKIFVALEYRRDPAYKKGLTQACGSNIQCNWYAGN